jgi:TetR/AcrR family transcriptional regulator
VVKESGPTIPSTQERILSAAREVFLSKGMDGARMQEIADHAGINKALLHYYFRNKETLFHAVFAEAIRELLPALTEVFRSDRPLLEKIPDFFALHIGFVQANPMIPHFIISEISRNPQIILNGFRAFQQEGLFEKFASDVRASVQKGEIKPIEPTDLIINLLSLSVFPFLARPVFTSLFGLETEQFDQMLEARKSNVSKFVINALK